MQMFVTVYCFEQKRNRQGQSVPLTFFTGKFFLTYRENRGKEKRENGEEKEGKLWKRKWEIKNGRGRSMKISRGLFCFCFVLFCFVLVCFLFLFRFVCLFVFSIACHFLKPLKSVLGVPNGKFLSGKKHISRRGKSGKMNLPLQKNIPLTPLALRFSNIYFFQQAKQSKACVMNHVTYH